MLKNRVVLVLLFVFVVLVVCCVLFNQLNFFVHGDLYSYGLIFSRSWVDDFWFDSMRLWVFLIGAAALSLMSIIPHYSYSKNPSKYSKWFGFLLPAIGALYLFFCMRFLQEIDWMVQNTLLGYGLVYNAQWSSVYYSFSTPAFFLMFLSLGIFLILSLRTLDIINVEAGLLEDQRLE